MKKLWVSLVAGLLVITTTPAADNKKEVERVENSGIVISEILDIPDDIPQSLLDKSECVIIHPSVLKAAFIVGASYGRGVMTCRTGEKFNGPWGSPTMVALEGGSVGLHRDASAETDAAMRAEILSYSRARGVFAGISLEGSTLRPDNDANVKLYGGEHPAKDIVLKGVVAPPPAAGKLLATLNKKSPKSNSAD